MTSPAAVRFLLTLWCALGISGSEDVVAAPALAPASGGALLPRLSPDGKWIAVSYQGLIGKVPLNGGSLTVLSRDDGWNSRSGVVAGWKTDRLLELHTGPVPNHRCWKAAKRSLSRRIIWGSGPFWFHPDGRRILGRFNTTGASVLIAPLAWLNIETGEVAPLRLRDLVDRIRRILYAVGRWPLDFFCRPFRYAPRSGRQQRAAGGVVKNAG